MKNPTEMIIYPVTDIETDRLFTAARSGDLETLSAAVSGGRSLNVRGKHGASLLHEAATHGRVEICEFLMDYGVVTDVWDDNGNTALMDAASGMHHDVMRRLIANGADADARNHYGTTVLHHTCLRNDVSGAKILLWAGANPGRPDANGMRPAELMRQPVDRELVTLIRACLARAKIRALSPDRAAPRGVHHIGPGV